MYAVSAISDFFISSWIFSITYDWFHVIINTLVLCLLLNMTLHMPLTRAVLASFSAHFFAFITLAFTAIGFFTYRITIDFSPYDIAHTPMANDMLIACLHVALIYAIFQSFFLAAINIRSEYNIWKIFLVIWTSNAITALLSYVCITTLLAPLL